MGFLACVCPDGVPPLVGCVVLVAAVCLPLEPHALVVTKRAVERHINSIFLKLDLGESEDVSRRVKAALVYLSSAG